MGTCMNKDTTKEIASSVRPSNRQREMSSYQGLEIVPGELSTVIFHHTPLAASQFLQTKFTTSANRPQEVNLSFMILKVEIDEKQNKVSISFMNENEINLYLILGGEEGVSNTGLTVELSEVKFVEKVNRKTGTPKEGNMITVVTDKINREDVRVVLEPILKTRQSMYIIHRYSYDSGMKKYKNVSQSLQWSSLAFNLLQIYGAQDDYKCDAEQQCSVCLSNPVNVIITPCRHMCMCNQCSKSYEKSSHNCPICRSEIRAFIQYQ